MNLILSNKFETFVVNIQKKISDRNLLESKLERKKKDLIHIDNKEFEKVNPFEFFIDRILFDLSIKDPKGLKERK